MHFQQSLFEMCRHGLILLVTLALSNVSIAGTYELRLLFADVPGTEEYLGGNLDAAIGLLESREKMADNNFYVAKELATLCAFYILKGNLDAAGETCSAAVEIDQSLFAYNNRGVLRAKLGDSAGALEDFDRGKAYADDQNRLIVKGNFDLVTKFIEKSRTNKWTLAGAVTGANIEDIID